MLQRKKKVEQGNRDQGHWEGSFDWCRLHWGGATGETFENRGVNHVDRWERAF